MPICHVSLLVVTAAVRRAADWVSHPAVHLQMAEADENHDEKLTAEEFPRLWAFLGLG